MLLLGGFKNISEKNLQVDCKTLVPVVTVHIVVNCACMQLLAGSSWLHG